MNETATNSRSTLRWPKIDLRYLAWFSLLVAFGGLATLFPLFWVGALAALALLAFCWLLFLGIRRAGLQFWQALAISTLTGYLVLNYGFDNLAIHVGSFPILISYGAMYTSFALCLMARRESIADVLNEPALLCIFAILLLSFVHLLSDVPAYGTWAFRDCTMCFDAIFLLMGLLWSMKSESIQFITKWLMIIFVLNMLYSFTLPWAETIWSWSPQSGAFITVPLFGNYSGSGDILLEGAVFCICFGGYVISRPRWLMPLLTIGQLLGIAVTQVRRMYLGIVVVIVILILAGEIKKFARIFLLVPVAVGVLVLVTSIGGLQITGRIGPVNLDFFKDHIRSMSGDKDMPGSSVESRFTMVDEAMDHFYTHPIFGVGFGQALLEDTDPITGAVTRMPHDSSITYLARLGVVGFIIWVVLHLCFLQRFFVAYRRRHSCDKRLYTLALWFFLFYIMFMIGSFVEGPFEYPSKAIPFYFLMGFGLGVIRWHLLPSTALSATLPVTTQPQGTAL